MTSRDVCSRIDLTITMNERTVKTDFDKLTDSELLQTNSVLLHCCCAPCAAGVIERILPFNKNVTLFYSNDNIDTFAEWEKRLTQLKRLAQRYSLPLVADEYSPQDYYARLLPGADSEREGGKRCETCFALRLEKTLERAKRLGISAIATTLTVSPHKNPVIINAAGERVCDGSGIAWIHSDFKKRDGFLRSTRISREMDLYRQNYCGCEFEKRMSEAIKKPNVE